MAPVHLVHSVTKSLRKSEVSVFTISCRWVCSAHNSPSTCQHRGLPTPQVVEAQVEAEAVLKRTLEQLIDQRGGKAHFGMQADFVTVHVGIQEFPTVRGLFDEDVSIEGFSCRPTLQCRRTSRVSRTVPAPAPVRGEDPM